MIRHIFLRLTTGEICRDPDEYALCAQARWDDLYRALSDSTAPFYKRVKAVNNIECEALYEASGVVFELLLELESDWGMPDLAKPLLQKTMEDLCTDGRVESKRVVPQQLGSD